MADITLSQKFAAAAYALTRPYAFIASGLSTGFVAAGVIVARQATMVTGDDTSFAVAVSAALMMFGAIMGSFACCVAKIDYRLMREIQETRSSWKRDLTLAFVAIVGSMGAFIGT